jgi:hypothetical protein
VIDIALSVSFAHYDMIGILVIYTGFPTRYVVDNPINISFSKINLCILVGGRKNQLRFGA